MPTDSKPPILPTSVGELQSALTESLEPPADAADSPAASAPTDAAPALPAGEPPELAAIRRDYGEAGVQHVMLEAHRAHLATEHEKLAAVIPGWSDPEARKEISDAIRAKARGEGYSDAELNAVTDSRAIILAYGALQRDKERARRQALEARDAGDAPTPAPAPARRRRDDSAISEAAARLEQTHRQRDAQRLIEKLLP